MPRVVAQIITHLTDVAGWAGLCEGSKQTLVKEEDGHACINVGLLEHLTLSAEVWIIVANKTRTLKCYNIFSHLICFDLFRK